MNRRPAKLGSAQCEDWSNGADTNRRLAVFSDFRIWITAALICLSVYPGGCKDPLLQSKWTVSPPTIDGNDSDWQSTPAYKREPWPATLKLNNDAGFLYILLSFEDPMLARRLRDDGIGLEITGPGDQNPSITLRYTGLDSLPGQTDLNDSFWDYLNTVQKDIIQKRLEILHSMIRVIQNGRKMRIPANGEQGPAAARIVGEGHAVFEFKIPIRTDKSSLYAIDSVPGQTILITVTSADQQQENMTPLMEGPGGNRSDNRWAKRSALTESDIRIRVQLAEQK